MSTSTPRVRLGPSEIVGGRPFTNPDRNAEDLAALRYMRERLCRLLSRPEKLPDRPRPLVLHFLEDDVRNHRIVISRLEGLLSACELTFVAFCGHKRPGADRSPLNGIDVELIDEFDQHPDLLSYSSLELESGDWRNLVLLRNPEGIEHWRTSTKHAYAARELAPKCYTCVRLHGGVFPGGLMSDSDPIILRTKYYDFQDGEIWQAIREPV